MKQPVLLELINYVGESREYNASEVGKLSAVTRKDSLSVENDGQELRV